MAVGSHNHKTAGQVTDLLRRDQAIASQRTINGRFTHHWASRPPS